MALFNGIFALVLRRPALIVGGVLRGVAVLAVLGLVAGVWLPAAVSPVALLGGALASVLFSHAGLRGVLRRADHTYVAAL